MCQGYHLNKTGNHCNHLFSGMSPEEPLLFYRIGHFCLEKWNILQKMWNIITRQFSATKTPTKLKFFPIRHMKKNSPWNTTATIRIIEITKLSIDCYIVSTMFLPVNLIIWYLHWCGQLDFPSSKGIDCVFSLNHSERPKMAEISRSDWDFAVVKVVDNQQGPCEAVGIFPRLSWLFVW